MLTAYGDMHPGQQNLPFSKLPGMLVQKTKTKKQQVVICSNTSSQRAPVTLEPGEGVACEGSMNMGCGLSIGP